MTTTRKLTTLVAAASLALAIGCSPDDPTQVDLDVGPLTGHAALRTYVALGDGLTAGFMDGGLVAADAALQNGQFVSYPAQIAGRIGYTGTVDPRPFAMPLIDLPGVGITNTGDPNVVAGALSYDPTAEAITLLGSTPRAQVPTLLANARHPVPYDNLGVPGATAHDASHATSSADSQSPGNAYFDLILRNPTFGGTTMLQQAIGRGPTLVTLWIGEADILGGARGGSPEVGVNITPPSLYGAMLGQLIDDLQNGVRDRFGYAPVVVLGNLRSVTSLPYFVPKALFDQVVGMAIPTEETDVAYVLFPTLQAVQSPGFTPPIPAASTLTTAEAAVVDDAVADYNAAIADVADARGLEVADLAAQFGAFTAPMRTHFLFLVGQGLTVGQAAAATQYSLDGIHPNSHGYTIVAGEFITAINRALELSGEEEVEQPAAPSWDPTYSVFP